MKVCHFVTSLSVDYGGPATVALQLALRRQGPTTVVGHDASMRRSTEAGAEDLRVIDIGLHGSPGWHWSLRFPALSSLPRLLSAVRKSDVVHIHLAREWVPAMGLVFALLLDKKIVVQPHGMVGCGRTSLHRLLDKWIGRLVTKSNAEWLFLTMYEKGALLRNMGVPIQKMTRLENGVGELAPRRPGRTNRPPHVVFLGRIHPRKRAHLCVDAAGLLHDDGYPVRVTIAGPDAGASEDLKSAISRSPAESKWVGQLGRADVDKLLADADVLLLPSRSEPYPLVLLEALRHRTPVVCTTECGLAEVVREYGVGEVVPVDDVYKIAHAIKKCMELSVTTEFEVGLERLVANESWASRAELLEQIYSRTL